MQRPSRNLRYCIIGAGASGLAVAKNFVQRGIPFDCLEREQDIGGLWNIATPSGVVYESTHL
ncbi:MAG TPA: NAD(P)-binding protein, partial [Hyphomicrobiaceae bacterium]|nr:NAD(P)-binding protein [Hyphomicrobiaceae bacterium]